MLDGVWRRVGYLCVVLGLIGGHVAVAQPLDRAASRRPLSFWEVTALQRYRPASEFENRQGDLGFHDSELQVARSQLTPFGVLKLGVAYTYTQFNFAGDTDLGLSTSKPFVAAHDGRVSLQFSTRLRQGWFARVFGTIGARLESGASIDDAIYGRFGMGLSYQISDRFSIGPGVFVRTSFADDVTAFPLPLIDWKITERLSFRSRRDFRLSYVVDAHRTVTLSAVALPFNRKQFRLDRDGPVPGGVAELKSVLLGAEVRWQPIQPLTVKGNVSAVIKQKLLIEDGAGREVVDEDLKNSAEMMVSVRYRF